MKGITLKISRLKVVKGHRRKDRVDEAVVADEILDEEERHQFSLVGRGGKYKQTDAIEVELPVSLTVFPAT